MKKALVISGGGSRGAFAVGVIKYLTVNFPLSFDAVVGTSTGALIAPYAAVKNIPALETLYTTLKTSDIFITDNLGNRIDKNSIYQVDKLFGIIQRNYDENFYQQLMQSGKEIYIVTVCLQTAEIVVFTTAANPIGNRRYGIEKIQNAQHLQRAVLASACQPVFMPPIKVNEVVTNHPYKNYQYVDGGMREIAGVEIAIDADATEIFTILLSAKNTPSVTTSFNKLQDIILRSLDIFLTDVGKNDLIIPFQYNDALKYIEAVKNKMKRAGISTETVNEYFYIRGRENPYEDKLPLQIHLFQPNDPLGGGDGGLRFDPTEMRAMLAKGEAFANDYVAALPPGSTDWA